MPEETSGRWLEPTQTQSLVVLLPDTAVDVDLDDAFDIDRLLSQRHVNFSSQFGQPCAPGAVAGLTTAEPRCCCLCSGRLNSICIWMGRRFLKGFPGVRVASQIYSVTRSYTPAFFWFRDVLTTPQSLPKLGRSLK